MTESHRKGGSRPRRQYRQGAVYTVMAFILLAIAVPLWWFTWAHRAVSDHQNHLLGVALLVVGFVAVEFLPLRIEVRHETTMITLTEIPLVVGLLLGIPAPLVGLSAVAAASLVFLIRRDSWKYLILNLLFSLLETGVTAAIFVAIPVRDVDGGANLGWQYLALLVGTVASTLLPSLAISRFHGLLGSPDPVTGTLVRSSITTSATTTFTLVGYTLFQFGVNGHTGAGIALGGGLAIAMVVLYRIYAQFLRQHLDLSRMYEFGRRVSGVGTGVTEWRELLEQVRDQLNAQVATVYLAEPNDGFQTLAVGPDGVLDEPARAGGDILLALASASGGSQVSTDRSTDPAVLAALSDRHAWDVLVAPLKSGSRSTGFLEVRNRRSRWGRFSANDLRLLETQARNIATELDNQRLLVSLRHEAHHDAITGLYNWRGLIFHTEAALKAQAVSAVLVIQLGVLPEVNNAVGHERGEQLLISAGNRLINALGGDRIVAHLESDRFGVLVESLPETEVEQVALNLLDLVSQPYSLDGIDVEPHARAGIAFVTYSDEGEAAENASALMQRAEMALTAAQASDEPMRSYGTNMGEVVRRRFQLVTQFRRAVEQGLITVHYQPKVNLADRELVGMEALVRWAHPEFGQVSPAEFVEAIEATGSIDILLEHVLDIVLAQIATWMARNIRIAVAVNMSVRNLAAPNFPARVARALARHKVPPELLIFEITESSVMADPERSLPILNALHNMGIRLSVDDFGTGYSSLAYLRRLPIDEIKIDKSFVLGMVTDLGDLAIVRAIIDLGHSLGMRVVAEGVEEEAARDALRTLRCDEMQGFLLSRPQPIDRLEAWLSTRTVRSTDEYGRPEVGRLVVN